MAGSRAALQAQAHTIDGILLTKFDTIDDKARPLSTATGANKHMLQSWFACLACIESVADGQAPGGRVTD